LRHILIPYTALFEIKILKDYKKNQGTCLTKMQVPLLSSQEPDKFKM